MANAIAHPAMGSVYMKLCGPVISSDVWDASVRLEAMAVPAAAMLLGAAPEVTWADLVRAGSIHVHGPGSESLDQPECPTLVRDFGDSIVRCRSNGSATSAVYALHAQPNPLRTPSALYFAFVQQWVRQALLCVHGALLRIDGVGILALGRRGAGKSILCASAGSIGGAIVTDDLLLLGRHESTFAGERCRTFLSLRQSWATNELVPDDGQWRLGRSGNRAYFRIPENDPDFPAWTRIDRFWILERPRGERRETSSASRMTKVEAYASLVSASHPLLLNADLPFERQQVMTLIGDLVTKIPAARVVTGQDIITSSAKAWRRLLEANS